MKTKRFLKKAISIVLLLSLTVFVLASCSDSVGGIDEPLPHGELLEAILGDTGKELDTVADYLDFWRFPRFSKSKLETLERLYRTKFVEELPTPLEKAREVGKYFVENFYDGERKTVDETTDMLIYSFVETLDDKYSIYRTAEEYKDYDTGMSGSFVGIGVTVVHNTVTNEIRVESVHEGGGAHESGILPGDFITKVNGEDVKALGYEKTVSNIKGEEGTNVSVSVLRNGTEITFNITRKKIVEKTVSYKIENGIAYIKITGFKGNTASQFKNAVDEALKLDAKGIIYDLRDNPGGYLDAVVEMLEYIAPKGTLIASFTNNYMEPEYSKTAHTVTLPTVVICNGDTASAAELFTAGIRDFSAMGFFKATLVGEKTFGKGIMQSTYLFSDNSSITMTVAYYNPPSGINYHDEGIIPNVTVEDGKDDPQLKAAYLEIEKLK